MELLCEFSDFQSVFCDESIYKCQVTGINRLASNGRVINVHGTHLEGRTSADVHTVTIFDHQIENFPRYLCNFFPNLKSISIIACGLKSLSKFDFVGCEGIEKLMLNGNKIASLSTDVFEYAQNLQTISFFNNQIEFLDENVFDNLKKLNYVNFKMNSCIDMCFRETEKWKFSTDEIKTKLRKIFGNEKFTKNAVQEFFDAYEFLENFRDSAEIVMEDSCNTRIKSLFQRS